MSWNILIVEDEEDILQGLQELFEQNQYRVTACSGIAKANEIMKQKMFDGYILDVLLEDGFGYELLENIRKAADVPVIFVTAMDDEASVIKGLQMGCDDYITKPFRAGELLHRMEANLRRYHKNSEKKDADTVIYSGDLRFEKHTAKLFCKDKEIVLKKIEYRLLQIFLENTGILLTRDILLERIWDVNGTFVDDNTLSVEISRLRRKLGKYQGNSYIETIRGIGYRWKEMVRNEQ